MTKQVSKYTPAMEQMIRDAAPLNQALANQLAETFGEGFNGRSVIAKAIRMDVEYNRKVVTSKTGEPIEKKEALVAEIAKYVEGNLDGLEKASKVALQNVRNALAA